MAEQINDNTKNTLLILNLDNQALLRCFKTESFIFAKSNGRKKGLKEILGMCQYCFQKKICHIYLSEYLKLTGSSFSDIKKWELPLAAARLCECIPEGESKRLLNIVKRGLE